MKKNQDRVIKAALADLANGITQGEVASKYGITQGTIAKWKKKYGIKSENIPCDGIITSKKDNNIPCDDINDGIKSENIPSNKHKYHIKSTDGHLIFEDETGREITGQSNEDYPEWKTAYKRAVDSGTILF